MKRRMLEVDGSAKSFEMFAVVPIGLDDSGIAIAASRAGAVGLLDLTFHRTANAVEGIVLRLAKLARRRFGLVLNGERGEVELAALQALGEERVVLLTGASEVELARSLATCRRASHRVGLVVTNEAEGRLAERLGFDFVVAKGNEAGGIVGEETGFVLLQRLLARSGLPVHAWGGISPATAAACRVAGAAGAVLDWQLALTRESNVPASFQLKLQAMDGSETAIIACPDGRQFRYYEKGTSAAGVELKSLSAKVLSEETQTPDNEAWSGAVGALLTESKPEERLWAVGQDACFASLLSRKATTVAQILRLYGDAIDSLDRSDSLDEALGPDGPLARSHGTKYPILQGPMTRVSDVAEFCEAVAAGGALPFLALALMRRAEASALLKQTKELLKDKAWGVGILGFVDRALRAEQTECVLEARPPFAVIAGGRPDQAAAFEAKGIATYLHVPSPGLLDTFLQEGARRFIFEGRECGGHVGPRSSFVLWELMTDVLLNAKLTDEEAAKVHVAFAGGIHDDLSAAMVATLARPLVARGMKVGALLGTAYLFTKEIVETGAIVDGFQEVALGCGETRLVESGPGHAIRCAGTDFVQFFANEKQRLVREGHPAETIREELESLNLGRLRIASKGVTRQVDASTGSRSQVAVSEADQRIEGMYMIGQIAALRGETCTIEELHRNVSEGAVARLRAFRQDASPAKRDEPESVSEPLAIAIVGMSCLLPGATTLEAFWDNILRKRDLITDVPTQRFEVDRWYDNDRHARDKIYSKWGGFLEEIPFDPMKYGIPPSSLRSIEPGHLLALELVDQGLRDAGYADRNPYRDKTGVIFGVSGGASDLGGKYVFRALLPEFVADPDESLWSQLPEWTEDSFAGILPNVLAGRICNRFDFNGPNFTVDAACASSLAALYLGCRELADGSSDMMIVGGCDTVQAAFGYLCFSKSGALSPRGKSRAFDASADGIAISEGLASVVLKRLDDAERDGDRIYAVIRAVSGASDGKSKGMTAPRPEGQMTTLRRAYAQAGFGPETVGLFEAHGTGTAVGDATECRTLAAFLEERGAAPSSVAIGSVKSMIGHTKSTAGVAGIVKAALALHHQVLPPTLHVEQPNAKAGLEGGALYVNAEVRPWIRGADPRRAAVSSFGFGGTNFHAVLESYEDHPVTTRAGFPHRRRPAELIVLTGRSDAELAARAKAIAAQLDRIIESNVELDLADLAYTLHRSSSGARNPASRLAIVAGSVAEARQRLIAAAERLTNPGSAVSPGVFVKSKPLGAGTPLAFLFPGQGAQYPDMLRDLAVEYPEVANAFKNADAALSGAFDRRLSQFVFPPSAFQDAARREAVESIKATEVAQPALGACGVAILRLLGSFGLKPEMAGGHSYGELVALHAAGCMDEAALYRLSLSRGLAMRDAARSGDGGTMYAALASRAEVLKAIDGCEGVWLANDNSPRQTVISGTQAGIAAARERLAQANIAGSAIPVACAFHSPLVAAARDGFGQALREIELKAPAFPVYGNVTAAAHVATLDEIRRRLTEQIVREVRFVDQVEAMYEAGARVFVELGPSALVSKLVAQILGDRPHRVISCQVRDRSGVEQLLHALADLVTQEVEVNFDRLYEGRSLRVLKLDALIKEEKKPLASHLWLVDGGSARPHAEPRRVPKPITISQPKPSTIPSPHETNGHPPVVAASVNGTSTVKPSERANPSHVSRTTNTMIVPPASSKPNPAPQRTAGRPVSGEDAFNEFQRTMRRFIRSQERVLEAYYRFDSALVDDHPQPALEHAGNGHVVNHPIDIPASPSPLMAKVAKPAPISEPAVSQASPILPEAALKTPAADPAQAQTMLVEITSERTGYPAEMLELDANLEADLGIDSIKRVEIIGAFRRIALPGLGDPPSWFMEEMASAKTLRAVLAGVAKLREGSPPESIPQPSVRPAETVATVVDSATSERMLVEITSERTGYPAEMLELDANLEADLGIDSIKRVEIIGAFRRIALPGLGDPPSWFMEEMAAAKTLRTVLEGVAKLRGNEPSTKREPVVAVPGAALVQESTAPRCVAEVVEYPFPPLENHRLSEGVFVVSRDHRGVADELRGLIEDLGGRVAFVDDTDLISRQTTSRCIDRLRAEHGKIAGVFHLAPLRIAPGFPGIHRDGWKHHVDVELKGLLYLLQALAPELKGSEAGTFLVASASAGGGDFGDVGESESIHPWRGGLAGMLKTASKEWPGARFRSIDVDDGFDPRGLLAAALADGPIETGYRGGRRFGVEAIRAELPEAEADVVIRSGGVVLVTGGAQGITGQVVQELASKSRATFILVGRSPIPSSAEDPATLGLSTAIELRRFLLSRPDRGTAKEVESQIQQILKGREVRRTLAGIKGAGSQVEYVACDIRDSEAFGKRIGEWQTRYGRIDGLIHGAGIIEDTLIVDKTEGSFDNVLETKLKPVLTLVERLDLDRLEFVLLFSSVAGFFGNPGQVDYAAANEILNRIARRLKNLGVRKVVAMNWGPWTGAGMVSDEVSRQFEARGVGMVTVPAGRLAAWNELTHATGDDVRVLIGPGPWVEPAGRFRSSRVSAESTPLLADQDVVHRPGGVVEAQVVLDPRKSPYLCHHMIDGKPVLPLAVAMELMAEVAAAAVPDWYVTQILNVRMFSGVVFDDGDRTLSARAEPIDLGEHEGEWRVRLADPKQPARPLYEAMVRMASTPPVPPEAPVIEPIDQTFNMTAAETYTRWLFHGRLLWVIEDLQTLDESGMDTVVRPSSPSDCLGKEIERGWLIDPIVLDAGPQVTTFWSRAYHDTTVLPSRIKAYHCFGPIGGEPLEMRLRINEVRSEGDIVEATILYVRDGRVVGMMEGLESVGNNALNRITGSAR